MRILLIIFFLSIINTASTFGQFTHNIKADSIVYPVSHVLVGFQTGIKIRFVNTGNSDEENVVLKAILDSGGVTFYQDSIMIPLWKSKEIIDTFFKTFIPTTRRITYRLRGIVLAPVDENKDDDTITTTFKANFLSNIMAVEIKSPLQNEVKPLGLPFAIKGTFIAKDYGLHDYFSNVPARAQIRRFSDNVLVFQSDTLIPRLDVDSPAVEISFPIKQGQYDITKLVPAKYRIALLSRQPDDGDHNGDTVFGIFSIMPPNNITADSIITPINHSIIAPSQPIQLTGAFTNSGFQAFPSVLLKATIQDSHDSLVYIDSQIVFNWIAQDHKVISFRPSNISEGGTYRIRFSSINTKDELSLDDTLSCTITLLTPGDIFKATVINPSPKREYFQGSVFDPVGEFSFVTGFSSTATYSNIPVTVQFRKCSDHSLAFQTDTIIQHFKVYQTSIAQYFPTSGGSFHIDSLLPGCYDVAMIISYNEDTFHLNDTAFSQFEIISVTSLVPKEILRDPFDIQNYPNPFTSSTTLTYLLPEDGSISINIFDITGRSIMHMGAGEIESAGIHSNPISFEGLSRGTYSAEFTFKTSSGKVITKRIPIQHLQ